MEQDDRLYINGIDGVTGQYLTQPVTFAQVAARIKGQRQDSFATRWLRYLWRILSELNRGLPPDVDPTDLRRAGWAIVFHADEDPAVRDALAPLIEHRRGQISNDARVKVLDYRLGEDPRAWLQRHRIDQGSGVEPTKVPYYLLVVGSPARIPFSFGHLLVEYAVGRLHFNTPQEYAQYVASLLAVENREVSPAGREAVFFATRHRFDPATQASADLLVNPLADEFQGFGNQTMPPGFGVRIIMGADATKTALSEMIAPTGGLAPPALLFTATHGMGWPRNHPRQRADQGALVCQDWPGFGTMQAEHYFAASDIPSSARVHGMVAFSFACYGAGTPSHDRYAHAVDEPPPQIADEPFFAALPQALLSHPGGGALAWIGHVERAWSCSITGRAGPQLSPFRNTISRILAGEPIGHAMKDFRERYAALSTDLASLTERLKADPFSVSNGDLVKQWVERNDAEGYVMFGDPAARLQQW